MDMRIIPPLKLKIMFESNPLKSRIVVWRLAIRLLLILRSNDKHSSNNNNNNNNTQ